VGEQVFASNVHDLCLPFSDSLPGSRGGTATESKENVVLQIAVGKHLNPLGGFPRPVVS
jgi:hypothetical protein